MDWVTLRVVHRTTVIDRVASDVKKPAKHGLAYWYADRTTSVGYAHSALQPFRRRHCDGANPAFAKMLLHFERQLRWVAVHFVLNFEGVVDFRQLLFVWKFHVHYGTDYLNYVSCIHKTSLTTECHLRCGDLEQLCCDAGLTHLVVFQGKVLDKLICIVGGVLHRHHSRAVLRRARVENHLKNLVGDIIRKHRIENDLGVGLEHVAYHWIDTFTFSLGGFAFRQIKTTNRQQCLHHGALANCVDKMCVEHRDFVDLVPQEFLHAKLRDRLRFNEGRFVFQFKISQQLALCSRDELSRLLACHHERRFSRIKVADLPKQVCVQRSAQSLVCTDN